MRGADTGYGAGPTHYTIRYWIQPDEGRIRAEAEVVLAHPPRGTVSFLLNPGLEITDLSIGGERAKHQSRRRELEGLPGFKVLHTTVEPPGSHPPTIRGG